MAPTAGDGSQGGAAPAGEWLKTVALAAYLLAHANGLFLQQRSTRSEAPTPSGIGQTIGLLLGFLAALLLDRRGTLAYVLGPANGAPSGDAPELHNPMNSGGAAPAPSGTAPGLTKRLAVEWGKGTVWGLLMAVIPIFFFCVRSSWRGR